MFLFIFLYLCKKCINKSNNKTVIGFILNFLISVSASVDSSVFLMCVWVCTIRPLVASSGSVMEAGVVRRFRARVSWSITASISCSSNRNRLVSLTDCDLTACGTVCCCREEGHTLFTSAPVLKW